MVAKQQLVVEGKPLTLSNLDKILYPGNGFTKAQVIDYYMKVSRFLLPHFARRPVTLNRFPDGVRGKAFYEKDAPDYLPTWAHTTNVPRLKGGEPIRYICIDDMATLLWCANVASLELHPFLHHAENLDCPTSIVFDLDPGEGVDLVGCAQVAFLLKALLAKNGLECFAKVSGSKGIQVYVPLNSQVVYEETRAAAQSVAGLLARSNPTLVVAEMAKQLRKGRVFIDWSQNSNFKTTVGVYSLRAKHDVPYVSAPVTWDELQGLLKKKHPESLRFEPEASLKRLDKVGDLFAPLLTLRQILRSVTEEGSAAVPTPRKIAETTTSRPPSLRKSRSIAAPSFIEPMLLLKTGKLPEGDEWLYEIKIDGFRALATKSAGVISYRSRNDNDFGEKFGVIVAALKGMPDETVVDGELVALDEEGKPSFSLLQNHRSSGASLVYYAFDLLMLSGKNLMDEPLTKRREKLEQKVFSKLKEPIRFSPVLDAPLRELYWSGRDGQVGWGK